jgi:ligand-binding SRPBCC domain-containing protein
MQQTFETRQWVPFPVELAFAFFANPHNLPHLMPPALRVRVEDVRLSPAPQRPVAADPARRFQSLAAGVGTELLVSFKPLGWGPRVSWTARIVEFDWLSHFTDEQVRGPFAYFRHRHGIEAETREGVEGTLVSDRIEMELEGVANLLGSGRVRRQMEESFIHRQKRLPEILAAAARQAARRT